MGVQLDFGYYTVPKNSCVWQSWAVSGLEAPAELDLVGVFRFQASQVWSAVMTIPILPLIAPMVPR